MGMVNKLKEKSKDPLKDPDTRAKIQRIAYEHGMSINDAKTHFLRFKG